MKDAIKSLILELKIKKMIHRKYFIDIAKAKLGAPIQEIEISEEQMQLLFEDASHMYFLLDESIDIKKNQDYQDFWIGQYFYALCKETLARIRGKFNGTIPIPGADITLNYKELLEESYKDKQFLKYLILRDENLLIENQQPILAAYIAVGNIEYSDVEEFVDNVKKKLNQDDLVRYFIPVRGGDSRIECVYPVNGIDAAAKKSIANMEKILIEISEEDE